MTGEVILAVAPPGEADVLDAPTFLGRMPNIGILYIASALETAGYPARALDRHYATISPFQLAAEIASLEPRLVGFSLFDLTMEFTRQTISILSLLYSGPVIVGGYTATYHAEDILREWPAVDTVFLNEAEESIVAYMRVLDGELAIEAVPGIVWRDPDAEGGTRRTAPPPPPDVTALSWPQRDWRAADDVTPIITRRGCTSACSFCSMVAFYDRASGPVVRYRDVEDVVDEIALCVDMGRKEFMFYDDDFGLATKRDRAWAEAFCDAVEARGLRFQFGIELRILDMIRGRAVFARLKQAGLSHMAIGMESVLPRQLALLNKGYKQEQVFTGLAVARETGIHFQTNVIFWEPFIRLDEAAEHLCLLDRIGIQDQLSSANYPFYAGTLSVRKSTRLYTELTDKGLLRPSPTLFYRFRYDFADQKVRDFHRILLPEFLNRTRREIKRPSALWMLVPRLELNGRRELANALAAAGRRLAREEFAYFQGLVEIARGMARLDPQAQAVQDLHSEFAARLRAASAAFPQIDSRVMEEVGCAVVVPETMLPKADFLSEGVG